MQNHARIVRDFVNQMKKSKDPHYCERVTADDGALGDQHLRDFQDNDRSIPTILTTSQKLSTGVDARNVRNIVLMRPINSIIEFKQIIGRGTRLFDGKDYFTIYDFVKAYEHFNDPEWDGEPLEPEAREPQPPGGPSPRRRPPGDPEEPRERPTTLRIRLADGKERNIQHMMATTFWGPDGKPMSAAQFVERLFGELPALFKDEDDLRALWSEPQTRRKLLEALSDKGFGQPELSAIERMIDAGKSDLYDVLAYIAFALAPTTRAERVNARKARIHSVYEDEKLRTFLDFVLGEYVREGVGELDQSKLTPLLELRYHAVEDAARELGGIPKIRDAFIGFQKYLYEPVN
jgi:type I restriction enzyme, R subunit